MTRPAKIEDHNAGRIFLPGFHDVRFFGGEQLRQRKTDGGERPNLQKFATIQARPAKTRTILWGFGVEI
jgi:hypothetical protein